MAQIFNNKKGFLARDWLIAIIFFGGVIAIAVLMVGSYTDTYNAGNMVDQQFAENYDNFQESSEIASDMQAAIRGGGGARLEVAAELVFKSTFTVLDLLWESITLPVTVLGHFSADFDIPSSVTNIVAAVLITALVVIIIFAVIGSLKKGDI